MIREIRGTVLAIDALGATIDVSGWGVFVFLGAPEALTLGSTVSLKTYLAVKQDGIDLYGFQTEEDRHFFELALTVSGVGPKSALSLLRRASRDSLESAISKRDIAYLTGVVGLSKKAAEKLCVELSEKIVNKDATHGGEDSEVFDTLVALGYTEREARKTLAALPHTIEGKDARLKAALSQSH